MKNKKILIGAIFVIFIMLLMPNISALNSHVNKEKINQFLEIREKLDGNSSFRDYIGWLGMAILSYGLCLYQKGLSLGGTKMDILLGYILCLIGSGMMMFGGYEIPQLPWEN